MTPIEQQLTPPGGWRTPAGPRVAPLNQRRAGLAARVFLWLVARRTKEVPNIFLVLMKHRRLFRGWLSFAGRLMPFGSLDRRDTELVILRVGWNTRCRYEWAQHVQVALRVGVAAEDIARIAAGPDAPGWQPRQAALLRAADDVHRDGVVAEATWQQLAQHFNEKRLIEVCMLIGHYEMLAGVLISLGVQLEPGVEAVLANAPIHRKP
jgi:AhpD family alkylhydroperoxidase